MWPNNRKERHMSKDNPFHIPSPDEVAATLFSEGGEVAEHVLRERHRLATLHAQGWTVNPDGTLTDNGVTENTN